MINQLLAITIYMTPNSYNNNWKQPFCGLANMKGISKINT